jgi:excisionase family DNA binding protein
MDHNYARQRLRQALRDPLEGFKELESALIEYEESIAGEAQQRPQERDGLRLLSVHEVCQQLGMGKSWVYRRLRSGEIPSVKLGRSIKVRRDDLEAYLEQHRHAIRPAQNSS